jgi:hypothetical protein
MFCRVPVGGVDRVFGYYVSLDNRFDRAIPFGKSTHVDNEVVDRLGRGVDPCRGTSVELLHGQASL